VNARGDDGAGTRHITLQIGAFAPEAAFLPALARLWLAQDGAPQDGLIILPSRRAAQALGAAFLEANGGEALLLPRIIALGNIDEAGLLLSTGFALPPAIAGTKRQALLANLILAMKGEGGAPRKPHAAWMLAAELASLLDEADYAEVDLAEALPRLVEGELAAHWQKTLLFLRIVTHAWPEYLRENGLTNPAGRLRGLIRAQTRAWQERPPGHRVWMVAAEGNPAIADMARVVAGLPAGRLLLPGYDPALDEDAWVALEDTHAQGGIARLLADMGARRSEVAALPAPAPDVPQARGALFSRALLPAAALGAWQDREVPDITGVKRLETPEESQNALAIAMILRDALERPGTTAALVTPDRQLAARVASALKRFGITADDSAGEPLAETPPAVFLRLLARAAVSEYAPLPLISLLKHPLAAGGLPPGQFRDLGRRLETRALRGPRPGPGFGGIKYRLETAPQGLRDFVERLELLLRPLTMGEFVSPATALRLLAEAGEALAKTDELPGAAVLWAGEAGIALSDLLLDMFGALADLPDMAQADLPDLLDAVLAGVVVRRPRVKDGHPRIAIWGIQEAALQSVDLAVLGGLVEGVWPSPAEPGPWLSRPMRKAAGLPSPELKIGQAAHGFFSLACACRELVLAAPARRERAPAVPARWLTRLDAMLAGAGEVLPRHEAALWAAQLDLPAVRERRAPPYPRPPAEVRPTSLSISDIGTLMADPYAIYARKILNLRELDGLDEESDQSLFGEIVHAGMAAFFGLDKDGCAKPDAVERLNTCLQTAMRELRPRAALEAWWAARLARIAAFVVALEQERRAELGVPQALAHEVKAELPLPGGFVLTGRADRIERAADGTISLIDYKTGVVPAASAVEAGMAPQLPLEAVMAEAGVFGEDFAAAVTELAYFKLSGRAEAGEEARLFKSKPEKLRAVIENAGTALADLFDKFADEGTAYLAAPHPSRENRYDAYAGISRRAEWAGEDGDDGD
jgi:ATP-dependent helicase/nuclease subunit B